MPYGSNTLVIPFTWRGPPTRRPSGMSRNARPPSRESLHETENIRRGQGKGDGNSGAERPTRSQTPDRSEVSSLADDHGRPIIDATGHVAHTPASFSPQSFFQQGLADRVSYANTVDTYRALLQLGDISDPTADNPQTLSPEMALIGLSLRESPLANFATGHIWDVQREHGRFHDEYRDAATIYIGIYAAAAGIPESLMQQLQNTYAFGRSHFFAFRGE